MIERDGIEYLVSCDECSWEDFFGYDDFYDVIDAMKLAGWKISKKDGEWLHTCPDCAYGVAADGATDE